AMKDTHSPGYMGDAENVAEMARLMRQARVITTTTGLLPPDFVLPAHAVVLDLACGPGEWTLKLAEERPDASITGADISQIMTSYARTLAMEQGLRNVHFKVMDILQPLAFPDASFDLIYVRLLAFVLSPGTWPGVLAECRR